jgi:beta-glucuronidase
MSFVAQSAVVKTARSAAKAVASPLYPRASETREVMCLDGMWEFRADLLNRGITERWENAPLRETCPMPVPASVNELTNDVRVRDHAGWFWYEREVFVPEAWEGRSLWLRFGAVWHQARVWIDGAAVAEHVGGYLPFECEAGEHLVHGRRHRLTVAVSNELDYSALPHGEVIATAGNDARRLRIHGDVYPHAGIHRSVWLCAYPQVRITDFSLRTRLTAEGAAEVEFSIGQTGGAEAGLELVDAEGRVVAGGEGAGGVMRVVKPRLWSPDAPCLYEVNVTLRDMGGHLLDSYRQPVGLRTVEVKDGCFRLNNEPFVFRGFGKTEDTPLRGKAFDPVQATRDLQLLRWTGANSIRTGHHPFAEEFLHLADRMGLAVIEEVAALSIWIPDEAGAAAAGADGTWRPASRPLGDTRNEFHGGLRVATLANHCAQLGEMIARDKNHACVFMWSLGNEIDTTRPGCRSYFETIAAHARAADGTRPITKVECMPCEETLIGDLVDVISVNRYYGWYSDPGDLEAIAPQLAAELTRWHVRHGKPVLLAEFGADAVAGLHQTPPVMFTEEFQAELIGRYLDVCERLPFVAGAQVWTFADFATAQGVKRVDGNKKGVFTRDRRPKLAAHRLRERWAGSAPLV